MPLSSIPHTDIREDAGDSTGLRVDDIPVVGMSEYANPVGEPARDAHHVPLSGSAHASQVSQAR